MDANHLPAKPCIELSAEALEVLLKKSLQECEVTGLSYTGSPGHMLTTTAVFGSDDANHLKRLKKQLQIGSVFYRSEQPHLHSRAFQNPLARCWIDGEQTTLLRVHAIIGAHKQVNEILSRCSFSDGEMLSAFSCALDCNQHPCSEGLLYKAVTHDRAELVGKMLAERPFNKEISPFFLQQLSQLWDSDSRPKNMVKIFTMLAEVIPSLPVECQHDRKRDMKADIDQGSS